VSKPRPRVGELPNPQPQRGLVPRPTAAIPGRSTELRQRTGPRTADLERHLKPPGQLPTARGPQAFFRSASASMCLSSVRSATKRFKPCVFILELPQAAELTHAQVRVLLLPRVERSLTPSCRQTSPTGVPAST